MGEEAIVGFDNIGVAVSDLDRAVDFYTRLGFAVVHRDPTTPAATLAAGTAVLYVFQTRSQQPALRRELDLTGNAPGIDHISLRVGDVDAAYRVLQQKGLVFESEPADQTWGARATSLLDPDGNRVYLLGPLRGA
ncbi:MAG: VOC family protein [Clostridia bacterium]|nr:VOC family protein [Clostridia bacterium]